MPYRIQWYVEERVILEEAFGDVTIEELVRFNAEVTDSDRSNRGLLLFM